MTSCVAVPSIIAVLPAFQPVGPGGLGQGMLVMTQQLSIDFDQATASYHHACMFLSVPLAQNLLSDLAC